MFLWIMYFFRIQIPIPTLTVRTRPFPARDLKVLRSQGFKYQSLGGKRRRAAFVHKH